VALVAQSTLDPTAIGATGGANVPSNQTDFVHYVPFDTMPAAFWSTVKSDGSDLRVKIGATELPREIVDFRKEDAYLQAPSSGLCYAETPGVSQIAFSSFDKITIKFELADLVTDAILLQRTNSALQIYARVDTHQLTFAGLGNLALPGGASWQAGVEYTLEIFRTNTTDMAIYLNGGLVTSVTHPWTFYFAGWIFSADGSPHKFYEFLIESGGSATYHWSADLANQTGSVLPDATGTSDANLVGYATDDSQWGLQLNTGGAWVKQTGTLDSSSDVVLDWYSDGTSSEPVSGDAGFSEDAWTDYAFVDHGGSATDSAGNATVTVTGGPISTDDGPFSGLAYDGGMGDSSYITYTSIANIQFPYTLQAWAKRSASSSDSSRILGLGSSSSTTDYSHFNLRAAQMRFLAGDSTEAIVADSFSAGVWHMLHGVVDSSTSYTAFANATGGTEGTTSVSFPATIDQARVGASADSSPFGVTEESIAEVRVRNTALSDDWIAGEYNNQSAPTSYWTNSAASGGGSTVSPFGLQSLGSQFGTVAAARLNGVMQQ